VQKGLIWNQLTIKHKDGESLINGLSKRLSAIVITCIETVGKSQETIEIINSRFEKDLYFRNSEFLKIKGYLPNKEQLIKLLNNKKIDIEILISKKEQQILLEVINEENSRINDWNRSFVKKEIEKYDLYFKSVESDPLTEEQIKASIIMEDNNLLIAAAGSGKTSVIVSKLGYLIQKNYAKPEEILILSFNVLHLPPIIVYADKALI
jgi:primosomal protein N'